jgi:hypothetical protein
VVGHRAALLQLRERLLRQVGRQLRIVRETIQIPDQPVEMGVEQLHQLGVERRCRRGQGGELQIVPISGTDEWVRL